MVLVSESDREHLDKYGYVVLEDVVSAEKCQSVIDDTYAFLGKDPSDSDSWYEPIDDLDEDYFRYQSSGVIPMYFSPSLWEIRQDRNVYQAYAEILEEENLWVSIDRMNFTPPKHTDYPELVDPLDIHWDLDTATIPDQEVQRRGTKRMPYGVQGSIFLHDTSEEQGGFACVPDAYQDLYDGFLDEQEEKGIDWEKFGNIDIGDREVINVGGNQGDLLIWDSLLPHANGVNNAAEPRIAAFVTMSPERFENNEARENRIATWRELELQTSDRTDPREYEKEHFEPADLTPLGQKLLGLDPWPGWIDT